MRRSVFRVFLVVCGLFLAAGAPATDESTHEGCDHAHSAPHGGTLIPLGDHVGHVELMLDAEEGTVRLYVLGAHAEKAVRIADPALTVDLLTIDDGKVEAEVLELQAVASLLTGEKVGDTSEFAASHPALVGASHFTGRLRAVTLRGVAFKDVAVSGEAQADAGDHDHAHDHAQTDHGHDH